MLERAVAAVKADKAKGLDMFNTGEGGFKDRDLYVFCANASDGILTAHPYGYKGKQLRDIKGYHGAPLGETIMQNATEGTIKQTGHGGHGHGGHGHHGHGHGHGGHGHWNHGHWNHGHGHGHGRWWRGHWYGYGVGACWRWTPGGYVWICY
jgi:hypothetical protein